MLSQLLIIKAPPIVYQKAFLCFLPMDL